MTPEKLDHLRKLNGPISSEEDLMRRLIEAYETLPALLDHIDNLTRQIEAYGPSGPKVNPKPLAKHMTLGDIQRLLREKGLIPKGDHE